MEKVRINGGYLAYSRRGGGAPLLLIHGFPLDHEIWNQLANKLEASFDLIMPDLRGFGQSDLPEVVYSIEEMARDLASFLNELGIEKTYLVGHSMGGYVTLAFAKMFPERLLGLGLLASQALSDTPERITERYITAEQVAINGVGAVVGMAEKLSADPQLIPLIREIILRQPAQGVICALKAMAGRADFTKYISSFDFPVVLVHGQVDGLMPLERAKELKRLFPKARLFELPRTGHVPMLEAPVETALALLTFIS